MSIAAGLALAYVLMVTALGVDSSSAVGLLIYVVLMIAVIAGATRWLRKRLGQR